MALFLTALLVSRRAPRPTEALLWLAFGGLALLSIRNVIWWGWVSAPGLALSLATLAARLRPAPADATPRPRRGAPSPRDPGAELAHCRGADRGGAGGHAAVARPGDGAGSRPRRRGGGAFPGRRHGRDGNNPAPPPGPLFNYMEWGGYLEWVLYPQQQLFIDGRFEARQPQVWDDYLAISRGAATWRDRLATYGVRTLVLNKAFHAELIPLVQADPHWQQVYDDAQAVVFTARP